MIRTLYGFLENCQTGRWSSLRGLRVRINGEKDIQYAALWITACIHLHAFAIKHEDGQVEGKDSFLKSGITYMKNQKRKEREWRKERLRHGNMVEEERDQNNDIGLLEGKIKREELKDKLFTYINYE